MIRREFRGRTFEFVETPTAPELIEEIFNDNYKMFEKEIDIRPGDIILDIGANEGIFAVLMGKMFPEAQIFAYEPVPRTFDTLLLNIQHNEAYNVNAYQFGVGGPGVSLAVLIVSKDFSGGSTAWCTYNSEHHDMVNVHLVTLDSIFERHAIERCRLLKMDIEGMEYDALYPTSMLPRVDFMVMEVHMNARLDYKGRRPEGLTQWVSDQTNLVHVEVCKMAE